MFTFHKFIFRLILFVSFIGLVSLSACDSTGPNGGDNSDMTAPSAPTDLTIQPGNSMAELNWSSVEDEDLDGYNVYRSNSAFSNISNRSPKNESLLSNSSYTDSTAKFERDYFYAVSAVDKSGNESEASNTVETTVASGIITFESSGPDGSDSPDIYTINLSGSAEAKQVTTDPVSDFRPTWAPDASKIAFDSRREDNRSIFTVAADGTDLQRITNSPESDLGPDWSSDGSRIAFHSDRDGDNRTEDDIYMIRPNGGDLEQITNNLNSDFDVSWSPDGSRIVFASDRDGNLDQDDTDIFTVKIDGSGLRQITDNRSMETDPAWSPDGSKIAFHSDFDGDRDIYTVNPDGSGRKQLTDTTSNPGFPAWSPEGSRIVFSTHSGLFTMTPNGSDIRKLTEELVGDRPDWTSR